MNLQCVLNHPQALRFPANQIYRQEWDSAGGRILEQPTGHCVLYGKHGQRILLADPEGNPLHECLWEQKPTGALSLVSARLRLDWGQWVGIKPGGLVNTISLDLSRRPGWEQITQDDLRQMAARSLHSDLAMVRFFYRDEDVVLHGNGQATIHQVKDAFYVLPNGSFEEAKFMSCMSRMEWSRIDYLPVVELFLSLLPGTGSATFEFIRGLYDDQNSNGGRALQYRGIPAYPSEAAFRLFSLFFAPSVSSRQSPLEVFLDIERSHEVHWLPASDFPVRYMDEDQHVCVTVRNQMIQKVTWWDDPSGLSFNRIPESGLPVSDNRGAGVTADGLVLFDGPSQKELTVRPSWQLSKPNHSISWKPLACTWRAGFPITPPMLTPQEAFSSVLLYPDKSEMVGEKESQPFVFDFLDDYFEEHQDLFHLRSHAKQVLLSHCEAGLGSCLQFQETQIHTIWYTWPQFAQKHAQSIWNSLSRMDRLAWFSNFQFFPFEQLMLDTVPTRYDWIYLWIPFLDYSNSDMIDCWVKFLRTYLAEGSVGCVAGPPVLKENLQRLGLQILHSAAGNSLPPFRIHQTILPHGWLNPELTVWIIQNPVRY
ncbi:hypothetical protein [Candidatus Nitrospira allomarina]|uniref:Uncharacterized protein n=1 Tax=Candidatus Nitrospira allomarina TaxID=3020900 RepID=A0AA96JRQ9_9BACT|nr:hypothetical protein [Candidatus Nitrospira allomarina]WNM57210.1 hypothetical protein PP769_14665 [Candidatus Nitrospira allomarina]